MGGRGSSYQRSEAREKELRKRAEGLHKIMKDSGMNVVKSVEETMDMLDKSDRENKGWSSQELESMRKARADAAIKRARDAEEAQRKLESTPEYKKNFAKYKQKNIDWSRKMSQSIKLANEGKEKEAQKLWDESEKIYKSIPKKYRKPIKG